MYIHWENGPQIINFSKEITLCDVKDACADYFSRAPPHSPALQKGWILHCNKYGLFYKFMNCKWLGSVFYCDICHAN